MGFVLLEADREILAGKKCKRKGISALQAEAEALGWALKEAGDCGFHILRLESDCQQLVNLLLKEEELSAIIAELDDIKALRSSFRNIEISFIPHSSNTHADSLSKEAHARGLCFADVNDLIHGRLAPRASLNEPV
ncbi:hypothetical protein DY000_02032947 [Brassica cretica]|uniref:RNase H type-1 domain-containing protein n=1 Tax=Brassica cretica TaxID=69181 RepID=A0ABQ7DZP7_BRACR|nr:hypothetical protein DY000_02032947 [Brassica cretica]